MILELRNESNQVIDRGDGWKHPKKGFVITSCLDNEEHEYALDNVKEFSQIDYAAEESTRIQNYYDIMRSDNDLTDEDIKYFHYADDSLNPDMIYQMKILRSLGYTKEYSLEDLTDLQEFATRYISVVDKKYQETQKKIKDLILDESDQAIKTEYKSILKDLETSVSDFNKKINEEDFEYPEEIADLWPTLLNPSPFIVFRDTLK